MTLSSRISSLTGPDRAVDAEVAVALGWRHLGEKGPGFRHTWERDDGCLNNLPDFTADLNAAMSVVPDNWTAWGIWSSGRKTKFTAILTRLSDDMDKDGDYAGNEERVQSPRCPTPALALLAAAMMAWGL